MESINRAKVLWENWQHQQITLEGFGGGVLEDKRMLKFKYDFLRHGLYRISASTAEHEKLYLELVGIVTDQLQKQLYPRLWERMLHRVKVALVERPAYRSAFVREKQAGLELLSACLKSAGLMPFSGKLSAQLDCERREVLIGSLSKLTDGKQLAVQIRLEKSGMAAYQCPGYSATVTDLEGVRKSFEFSLASGITLPEALNLLQGRAVLKRSDVELGLSVGTWMQLERSGEKTGLVGLGLENEYDLKQVLMSHARELELFRMTGSAVQRSLEQGNLVSLELPGKGAFQLSADPMAGSLRFFKDQKAVSFAELRKLSEPLVSAPAREFQLLRQKEGVMAELFVSR